ncbi:hypothetical protein ABIC83_003038 [Roseateles asaccharophilus]
MSGPFISRKVSMSDDSELFEVVTSDDERIGAAGNQLACENLRDRLNAVVGDWLAESVDHTGG